MHVPNILVGRPTPYYRVHVVLFVGIHVTVEVLHEIFSLVARVTAVADFSGEKLNDSREWRECEERTYPRVIWFAFGGNSASYIGDQ